MENLSQNWYFLANFRITSYILVQFGKLSDGSSGHKEQFFFFLNCIHFTFFWSKRWLKVCVFPSHQHTESEVSSFLHFTKLNKTTFLYSISIMYSSVPIAPSPQPNFPPTYQKTRIGWNQRGKAASPWWLGKMPHRSPA